MGVVNRSRRQSWKGWEQKGEGTEDGRREEKADKDKLASLDSLGTTPWDCDWRQRQYPGPGSPRTGSQEALQGEAGEGCEQRRQK